MTRRASASRTQELQRSLSMPHLDLPDRPDKSMAEAERWAARIKGPGYAMDAQTAIKVTGDRIEVVSEGRWKLFNPAG